MSDSDDQNAGQPGPEPGGEPPQYGQPNPYGQPPQYGQPNPYGGGYPPYGTYGRPLSMPPRPKTHLAGAIISTLLCCLPAGVVAIVFAARVDSLYRQGDFDGSLRASSTAQFWIYISIAGGLIAGILWFVLVGGAIDSTSTRGY